MFLALQLAVTLALPNPALTPGVVRQITRDEICATRWGKDSRHVTLAMRRQVFAQYHVSWDDRRKYEVDHLIPRELGGADDVRNLWPQIWAEAHVKDKVENVLHKGVCVGVMSLESAQDMMRKWGQE